MSFELLVRPRALREIREILQEYSTLGRERSLFSELDVVFETLREMPHRFPVVVGSIHRALLRRYPYAVFFRIRAEPVVVVLAVLHQRRDPARWPR